MIKDQTVHISPRATAFTAVCELCLELDAIADWCGSTFAGRLDLDLKHGTFLCRRGHPVRVERDPDPYRHDEHGFAAA
jgi:hypothetical protein